MSNGMEFIAGSLAIGTGATLGMDLWAWLLKRAFGVPSLNYAMVGRWIGHFPDGRFRHDNIGQAAQVRHEKLLGWGAHYAIGIVFAALLLVLCGQSWLRQPTLLPALAFGLVSVCAPFFLMQPGMGAGIAASKTPNPPVARLRSLMTHLVFGASLYLSALLCVGLW
ncbi:MAG: DUF2938 domain-containing protein [Serratia inhibens]|uniref:DUF2938 domain-containing protein n=1 Tax=Serratia inhibens TaxID=2338073 RepID=UPI003C79B77B